MAKNDKQNTEIADGHDHDDDHVAQAGRHQGAHQEESEPWLVSYADMMTLLFGFFVVMYSLAAKDPRSEDCVRMKLKAAFEQDDVTTVDAKQENKDTIAFKAIQMLMATLNVESIEDVVEKLEENEKQSQTSEGSGSKASEKKETMTIDDLKALMGADEIKNTVSIAIPVDVVFAPGTNVMLAPAVQKLADVIKSLREIRGIQSISVIGHTDSSPPPASAKTDNWTLSIMRASEVAKFITSAGIDQKLVRVEGRGNGDPLLPEKGPDGRAIIENMAKNRRIEIMVIKDKFGGKG